MNLEDYYRFETADFSDPAIYKRFLAVLLKHGQISLLVGAGVSDGAALPNWPDLVAGCEAAVGLPPVTATRTTGELMMAVDAVRRTLEKRGDLESFPKMVRSALYTSDQLASGEYDIELMRDKMLIALGALVMSSTRGSVAEVYTLNFDDVLEWYLALHGYRIQVVPDMPAYLRGDVDVTVFHPHGFLPLREGYVGSKEIVFTHSEFLDRLAIESAWTTLLNNTFMTKRILAVGTSLNDIDLNVHLRRALKARQGPGPLGFVVTKTLPAERADELRDLGLAPIEVKSHADIPGLLLEICRLAVEV